MPIEHRQIEFSVNEVLRAVIKLNAVRPLYSLATPVSLKFSESSGEVSAVIIVKPDSGDSPFEVPLLSNVLAAALIRFCIDGRVPLPRSAAKRLVRTGDSLALHLDLNAATTPILTSSDLDLPADASAVAKRRA